MEWQESNVATGYDKLKFHYHNVRDFKTQRAILKSAPFNSNGVHVYKVDN
jgi:hypothetical protein